MNESNSSYIPFNVGGFSRMAAHKRYHSG